MFARLSEDTNLLGDMAGSIGMVAQERRETVSARRAGLTLTKLASFAACAVAVIVVGVNLHDTAEPDWSPYTVSTSIGQLEEFALSDGSVMKLNTNSQAEVDFHAARRRIRLLKGEAFFDVAHDASRPFLVVAGDKTVKAVGTAFSVRWTDDDLSVTVSEGRVAFAPVESLQTAQSSQAAIIESGGEAAPGEIVISAEAPLFLDAGQKLSFADKGVPTLIASVSPHEIQTELSWREGFLDFSQTPLSEIIDEINRYTTVRIEISDQELRELEFGGIFRTGEIEPLLDALELSFDIQVDRVDEEYVRIYRVAP